MVVPLWLNEERSELRAEGHLDVNFPNIQPQFKVTPLKDDVLSINTDKGPDN